MSPKPQISRSRAYLESATVAWLGHLQGETHHQLHQSVEHDVLHVDVDELVGKEPPGLLPSLRVVDEEGANGRLAGQHLLSDQAGDVLTVPDVKYHLNMNIINNIISISININTDINIKKTFDCLYVCFPLVYEIFEKWNLSEIPTTNNIM